MAKKTDAFFYNARYYLFPEGCSDVAELLEKYGNGEAFYTKELVEKKCMAPYFVTDYIKDKKIKLSKKKHVYPCEVELLSMQEYNVRLRKLVCEHCVGCPGYTPIDENDSSLEGHHEELTLDDVCFFRQTQENWTADHLQIDVWMNECVRAFGKLDLEKLIDDGKIEDATSAFFGMLAETVFEDIPPMYLGKREDGKYFVYCTCFFEEYDRLMVEALFKRLEKKYKKNWVFLSYLPKGFYAEEARKPLGITFEVSEDIVNYIQLSVYTEPEAFTQGYLWICGFYGEAELQTVCSCVNLQSENIPSELQPLEALTPLIENLMQIYHAKEDLICPAAHLQFLTPEFEDTLPEEEMQGLLDAHGMLLSSRIFKYHNEFVLPLIAGVVPNNIWETETEPIYPERPIARIVFDELPLQSFQSLGEKNYTEYLSRITALLDQLRDKNLFKLFGQIICCGSLELDGVILNLTSFLYEIRRFAPLFAECPAELYVYTARHENGGHYRLGYQMEILETESEMWDSLADSEQG